MAHLVHHTLNRNGTYTGGRRNLLPFGEIIITDKSRHKKSTETSKSTFFFHLKPMEERVILNIQYTGLSTAVKLKVRILVGYFLFFYQKSYIMTFCENKFSNFER